MPLAEVLDALDYSQSPYYLKTAYRHEPEVASLFRAAHNAGVDGIYVFQSSSEKNTTFSVRPAVYVAEAQIPEEAQIIQRNLSNQPFYPWGFSPRDRRAVPCLGLGWSGSPDVK
jgi:hypothetical protein